jgi:hypothetical protein
MRALKKDRLIFYCVVFVYLAVVAGYKLAGWSPDRVFPFFAWDLFTTVPTIMTEHTIYVREIDGVALESPRDLREYWRPLRRNDPSNFFPIPGELASAVAHEDSSKEKRLLGDIRTRFFLNTRSVGLSLHERKFDPLLYWHDHSRAESHLIREYHLQFETTGFEQRPTP